MPPKVAGQTYCLQKLERATTTVDVPKTLLKCQSLSDQGSLGGLTPHELRHTCASLAIAAGANVKVLQTLLGHKTATLTLDRYGHLFPDDLGRIADAFDAAAETTADWLRTGQRLKAVPSDQNMP